MTVAEWVAMATASILGLVVVGQFLLWRHIRHGRQALAWAAVEIDRVRRQAIGGIDIEAERLALAAAQLAIDTTDEAVQCLEWGRRLQFALPGHHDRLFHALPFIDGMMQATEERDIWTNMGHALVRLRNIQQGTHRDAVYRKLGGLTE